jgi:putative Mg2+ transporter-C (MgtC) family protein
MMSNVERLIRLLTAAALGSLIGFERERLLWAAGVRDDKTEALIRKMC